MKNNIKRLSYFDSNNWIDWILKIYKNEFVNPTFEFGDIDFDLKLLYIKNILENNKISTDKFAQAVISLLNEYCMKPNEEQFLYNLIQFLGALKPEKHASFLEIIFTNEVLKNKFYSKKNLHHVLLNSLIYFKNIDDLSGYFENALFEQDVVTCIIGLKYYLINKNSNYYFEYLINVLNVLEKYFEDKILIPQVVLSIIEMVYLKKNYQELYNWWVSYEKEFSQLNTSFQKMILREILTWLNKNNPLIENEHMYKLMLLLMPSCSFEYISISEYFKSITPISRFQKEFQRKLLLPIGQFFSKSGINPYEHIYQGKSKGINRANMIFFKKHSFEINNVVKMAIRLIPEKLTKNERIELSKELMRKSTD